MHTSESLSTQTRRLKQHTNQPFHLLKSIALDADFVHTVAATLQLPLVLNLRCGRWYADPARTSIADYAYFKSTDGHYGQWQVPTRRLNLHLLPLIQQHGGVMLVDSTRRGKRFPDALSKTVPLWCAAINALVFPDQPIQVVTLPSLVSASETSAMATHLQLTILPRLRAARLCLPHLAKPLRPIWLGQHSPSIEHVDPADLDYAPVYCVSASRVVDQAGGFREHGFVYIQGAADDEEHWSLGLTPEVFWANAGEVLASAEKCQVFLASLATVSKVPRHVSAADARVAHIPGTPLYIAASAGPASSNPWATFTHVLNCTATHPLPLDTYLSPIHPAAARPKRYLCLGIPSGKRGQVALGNALPVAEAWVRAHVHVSASSKVLVHCDHTRDRSVAVVVMLLVRLYMHVVRAGDEVREQVDKEEIRRVLVWMTNHYPQALPSRASLKQLNRYLIPAPSPPTSERKTD